MNRIAGSCGLQSIALAPWSAHAAIRNGDSYETDDELVYHKGWYLQASVAAREAERANSDSAHFKSGLRVAAYRINAFDIQMAGTRRAMSTGLPICSPFAFFSQMPLFFTSGNDQMPQPALGTAVGADQESDSSTPRVREGVGAEG